MPVGRRRYGSSRYFATCSWVSVTWPSASMTVMAGSSSRAHSRARLRLLRRRGCRPVIEDVGEDEQLAVGHRRVAVDPGFEQRLGHLQAHGELVLAYQGRGAFEELLLSGGRQA